MILINGKELKIEKFPNGEVCIRDFDNLIVSSVKYETITLAYENDQDLINLQFVKRHLDDRYDTQVILELTYMPYSRMDRTEGVNVFTLKWVSEMINSLYFDTVLVLEPHSDVTSALLDRCATIEKSKEIFNKAVRRGVVDKDCYLVFPDSTADKRYSKIGWDKTMTCIKHRDFETGKIKSLEVVGEKPTEPFKAVIIDDLCSRGGTFILTANKLREMGATHITLIVTHCEDSIHDGDIFKTDTIDLVLTTNSILKNVNEDRLIIEDVLHGVRGIVHND